LAGSFGRVLRARQGVFRGGPGRGWAGKALGGTLGNGFRGVFSGRRGGAGLLLGTGGFKINQHKFIKLSSWGAHGGGRWGGGPMRV